MAVRVIIALCCKNNFTAAIDEDIVAAVKAPVPTGLEEEDNGDFDAQNYHCIYGFAQNMTGYGGSQYGGNHNYHLADINLYKPTGGLITDKKNHIDTGDGALIIEGVNNAGSIITENAGSILPGGRTNGTKQEEWLAANRTTPLYEAKANTTFNPYPEESSAPSGGESRPNRNPLVRFQKEN